MTPGITCLRCGNETCHCLRQAIEQAKAASEYAQRVRDGVGPAAIALLAGGVVAIGNRRHWWSAIEERWVEVVPPRL